MILAEKGLQICWIPQEDIANHFIDVVFGNPNKCGGGPIQKNIVYQHLGIAQVFYKDPDSKNDTFFARIKKQK